MNEKRRREAQAGLSTAIHTLLEAIPHSAFAAFHQDDIEAEQPALDDARLLLAGEMMASAYLLLEKTVEPRDVLLNTWDLIATMTEIITAEHLSDMLPAAAGDGKKAADWSISDRLGRKPGAKKSPAKKAVAKKAVASKATGAKAAKSRAKKR